MEEKNGRPPKRERRYLLYITYAIVLIMLLYRIDDVWKVVQQVLHVLSPVFVAVAIAFVLHVPTEFFQHKVFGAWEKHKNPRLRALWRGASMLAAYLCVLLLLYGLGVLIVPRIIDSIRTLGMSFSSYLARFQSWADGMLSSLSVRPELSDTISSLWDQAVTFIQDLLGSAMGGALEFTIGLTTGVFNFVVSVMLSVFMLYNKDKLFMQFRRLFTVLWGAKRTRRGGEVLGLCNRVFSRFIVGQCTEAVILGTLCFLGMTLFQMHYALLISAIIAVTALVPILGAWIGTIPCAIILLVIDPTEALWFLVFIVVLQQLENNLIYPRVVGNAIGLPGLWVLLSVLLGGGLFGVWGMLLATPAAAVVYKLAREWVGGRERESIGPPEKHG